MSFNGLMVAWVVRQGSAELVAQVFERADANGDGRLQPAELQAALGALAPSLGAALRLTDTIAGSDALAGASGGPRARLRALFDSADGSGDGLLEQGEVFRLVQWVVGLRREAGARTRLLGPADGHRYRGRRRWSRGAVPGRGPPNFQGGKVDFAEFEAACQHMPVLALAISLLEEEAGAVVEAAPKEGPTGGDEGCVVS
jgi:hypothetical protein